MRDTRYEELEDLHKREIELMERRMFAPALRRNGVETPGVAKELRLIRRKIRRLMDSEPDIDVNSHQ